MLPGHEIQTKNEHNDSNMQDNEGIMRDTLSQAVNTTNQFQALN